MLRLTAQPRTGFPRAIQKTPSVTVSAVSTSPGLGESATSAKAIRVMIDEILERGRKSGEFRAGVDPVQLYISIASLTYFYLGNKYTLSAIFGRDLLSPRAKAERLAHMTELVLGYLLKA